MKKYKTTITCRVDKEIKRALKRSAKLSKETLSAHASRLLASYIEMKRFTVELPRAEAINDTQKAAR